MAITTSTKSSNKKSGSKTVKPIYKKKPVNKKKPINKTPIDKININRYENKREEILKNMKEINILMKKTLINLKELDTIYKKEIKNIKKNTGKNSGKNSGINKPAPVPKTLQKLLNLDDKPLARSRVSALMYDYIRKNNLFSPKTKKIMIPNKAMRNIFGMKKEEIIKFENFQTWLKNIYNEKDELILDIND
jgi:hypothetical protein